MKKTIFPFCLSVLGMTTTIQAQTADQVGSPDYLYYSGKKMYEVKNYAGCIDQMTRYKNESHNSDFIMEADYLICCSAYENGKDYAIDIMKDFLMNYPVSGHKDRIMFLTGSKYFFNHDYAAALKWLDQIDMDRISADERDDFCFRLALSKLKTGSLDKAKPYFTLLSQISDKYKGAALYYSAYINYQQQDYNKALSTFQKIKDVKPYTESVPYYIAQIHFVQRDYDQALNSAKQLLDAGCPTEYQNEKNRIAGECYFMMDDDLNAVRYLSSYVERVTSPLRTSCYMLGVASYRTGQYKQAIFNLSRAATGKDEITQNTYLYLGQSYLKTGDKKNARMAFETASHFDFDKQTKEVALYNYIVLIHETSFSSFGESLKSFENFLNMYPDSRYKDEVSEYLVELYLTTKNYSYALKSIEKINKPGKKILEAKQRILFQLGTEAVVNADYTKANRYFNEAIGLGNYNNEILAESYFWRGECYFRSDLFAQAASDYAAYLNLTKIKSSDIYRLAQYNLGYAYFKQKNFSQALRYFEGFVNNPGKQPTNILADAMNRVADCYFYNRNFAAAENYYAKAASTDASAADYAIFQKGFVAGLQKNYKAKIESMDRLIREYPKSQYCSDAMFEKGRTYVLLENNNQAIATFSELVERWPQSSNARKAGVQLGLIYFNQNMPDESIKAYKRVISNYPGSEEARVAAEDLKSVYLEKNDISTYAAYIKTLNGKVKFAAGEQDSLTYLAAEKLYMRGNKLSAIKSFDQYLNEFPDGAFKLNTYFYTGNYYFNEKQYDKSEAAYNKITASADNSFTEDALARLSEISFIKKDFNKAYDYFVTLESKAEKKENILAAKIGILRTSMMLNKNQEAVQIATNLLADPKLTPELKQEARFVRIEASINLGNAAKVVDDMKILSKDTRNVYGAQSKYLLAKYYFDNHQLDRAEKELTEFIDQGTPHQYWLARGFILQADIFIKQNDAFQARQYLLSLKNNYKGNDDISAMIDERLKKIGE